MNDLNWLRNKTKEQTKLSAERLAEARAEAKMTGKEPFDFVRLSQLYDVGSDLSIELHDPQAAAAELEKRYYLNFPEVTTLEEFAARMNEYRVYK